MSNYAKYKDLGAGEDSSKNIVNKSNNQGMAQQGMPPQQGMQPQQGMAQQGMPPQQGMVQQGMPQQGMAQQGMHHKGNQSAFIEVQHLEHKKHFINTNQICVVKIHADWCQPCKAIAPRYNQMAQKYNRPGVCVLMSENVDLNVSNVKGVPTTQFFKNGKYMNADIVGADIDAIEKRIIELLSSP